MDAALSNGRVLTAAVAAVAALAAALLLLLLLLLNGTDPAPVLLLR